MNLSRCGASFGAEDCEPGTLSQGIETMNLVLYRSEEMANLALCGGIGCRAGNVNLPLYG
jgi:hypothetical protein